MPRLVDYAARFEFTRIAVVRIAARDGGAAVTLESVAREMGVSVATLRRSMAYAPGVLSMLGLQRLERERRIRRYQARYRQVRPEDPLEAAVSFLRVELPLDEERLEEARAWRELIRLDGSDYARGLEGNHHAVLDAAVAELLVSADVQDDQRAGVALLVRTVLDGLTEAAADGRLSTEQVAAVAWEPSRWAALAVAALTPLDAGAAPR